MITTSGDIKKQLQAALDALEDTPDDLHVVLSLNNSRGGDPMLVDSLEFLVSLNTYELRAGVPVTELDIDLEYTYSDDE